MKILVFDTETTGLPTEKNASILLTEKWPYIVQLSYLLYDTDQAMVIDYIDRIIKLPHNIKIPKESTDIHKITNEMCAEKGVDIKRELIDLNSVMLKADIIVAHNLSFDKNMIMVECLRHKIIQNFTQNSMRKPEFCTMKNSVNICKILTYRKDGRSYYKYPKLMELHKHLFGDVPEGLHNSMVDVLACLRCYGKMKLDIDLNAKSHSLKILNSMFKV
jgi:DNA polymerase III epsilon subunit-like protein